MSSTIRIADHTREQLDEVRWIGETGYDTVILRLVAIAEAVFDIHSPPPPTTTGDLVQRISEYA